MLPIMRGKQASAAALEILPLWSWKKQLATEDTEVTEKNPSVVYPVRIT
jgi:hypothetical protein